MCGNFYLKNYTFFFLFFFLNSANANIKKHQHRVLILTLYNPILYYLGYILSCFTKCVNICDPMLMHFMKRINEGAYSGSMPTISRNSLFYFSYKLGHQVKFVSSYIHNYIYMYPIIYIAIL